MNPMPIAVTPEDVADAALFLASDLSRTITGVLLPVDCRVRRSLTTPIHSTRTTRHSHDSPLQRDLR